VKAAAAAEVKSAEAPRRRDVTALTERAVAAEGEASAWAERQGLPFVHFSAQRKRFLRNKGGV